MDDKFEQISIGDAINILIKRKKLIAGTIAIFLILGILSSFAFTKKRAISEISIEISNIDMTITQPSNEKGPVYNVLESIAHTNDIAFEDYLDEITSDEVLEKTIKDLNLEDKYSISGLKSDLSISSDPETRNVGIKLTSKDPDIGVDILNKLVENFAEHITRIAQENALQTLDIIEKQMAIEKEKYAEGLREYEEAIKGKSSAHELELEIEGLYEQITEYKLSLNDLEIKKEGTKAALEKSASSGGNAGGMIIRPSGGEGYMYLDTSKKALEIDLAETEARIKSTEDKIKDLQTDIGDIKIEYQNIEFAESVIRQKVELTKQSYEIFAQKHQELKMASSIDIGGISINTISPASTSNKTVGTRKSVKLGMSLIFGIMIAVILSFLVEYIDIQKTKKIKK